MKILVLNCGSSSLKYQLFDMKNESVLCKGLVEKIGIVGSLLTHKPTGGEKREITLCIRQQFPEVQATDEILDKDCVPEIPNHEEAIKLVLDTLVHREYGVISSLDEIEALGHRTVHGGAVFTESTIIDDQVVTELENLVPLAPLHNPPSIAGIKACQKLMPGVPMVAVFDTAFHQSMPESSYLYGLPYRYYKEYGIRRYGFHGTSHRFVSQRVAEIMDKPIEKIKIITCHLGNGSSIAAIENGQVMDTTMGFTPLEGLFMGTRSGNVDPAIIKFIMKKENKTIDEVDNILNKESGFLGISGVSSDMRNVEQAAAEGNERAQLALEMFYQRVVRFIGAFVAEVNGADVIVFTAGIGENSPEMREAVCSKLTHLGLEFDPEANKCRGKEVEITKAGSKVRAFVVPTNEELMIARDTASLIK